MIRTPIFTLCSYRLCILDRSKDEYSSNIAGFKGRMGQAACQMVLSDPELELVAVLDPFESASEWQRIPVFNDKNDLAGFEADVWVDIYHTSCRL